MESKFFGGLFEGDSANGARLGMGLTGGDFWPRPRGCLNLYRGRRWWEIDFGNIVAVGDSNAQRVVSGAEHAANETWYYVLRAVNGCGEESADWGAAVRAGFDEAGAFRRARGRDVVGLCAQRGESLDVRLVWFRRPWDRRDLHGWFRVYRDDGDGAIDFGNAIASIACAGAGIYSVLCEMPRAGRYRFCVRCERAAETRQGRGVFTQVDAAAGRPAALAGLEVKVV